MDNIPEKVRFLKRDNNSSNDKLLYFDIFKKNNELFLIIPVYNKDIEFINKIKIINNGCELILKKQKLKLVYEPIIILIYDFNSNNNNITVTYNNIVKHYELENINTNKIYKLTLTTIFKSDYYLFDIFYNYYTKQGVEHFYMYYNAEVDKKIKDIFLKKENVTLIEWNFDYWINGKDIVSKHHAQLGSLHHAIYRYGKDVTEYMIFCDFDEYLLPPNNKLINMIKTNHDTYIFFNIFSELLDNNINNKSELPIKFKVGQKFKKIRKRTKCIHKLDSIDIIDIHDCYLYLKSNSKIKVNKDYNNSMFHFYREGNQIDETSTAGKKFECKSIINITSKKHLLYDLISDLINNRKYRDKY
tara:strand:+ start:1410 stop:2483 length:1074 start_codon:yes stop_codon:yes gene_type:complete